MFHAWSTSNIDRNLRSWTSLTLSNSNLKFHTVVVVMLFKFDDIFTVTATARRLEASLTYLISPFNVLTTPFRISTASVLDLCDITPGTNAFCALFLFFLIARLNSLFDALSDSKLLIPRKLLLYLAQPIDSGADFEPIVNSNPNLNCIYINDDAGFDDEREKDLVLKVLRMVVKTFFKYCPISFRI